MTLLHRFKLVSMLLAIFWMQTSLEGSDIRLVVVKEEVISANIENFDCHSSCIIEESPGHLIAVWKGGPGNGFCNIDLQRNIGVWISHQINGSWSEPKLIIDAADSVCWTPVITKKPTGELLLFYRLGANPRQAISLVKRSVDKGLTWSTEDLLPAGFGGPIKSKPVFDVEGNMICGSSSEVGEPDDEFKETSCWIETCNEATSMWSKYGPLVIPEKPFGALEPTLFWGNQDRLIMLCRDRSHRIGQEGWIWRSVSEDHGQTWSTLEPTALPNPDSGIDTLCLNNGMTLLAYNHSHTSRSPLSLALSADEGLTWEARLNLEAMSGESPSLMQDSDGLVHVTYAWTPPGGKQRSVKHVVVTLRSVYEHLVCAPSRISVIKSTNGND